MSWLILHTSSPSFPGDVKVAEALKRENPNLMIGFVGAKVAGRALDKSLLASPVIDFVARRGVPRLHDQRDRRGPPALHSRRGYLSRRPEAARSARRHRGAILENMDQACRSWSMSTSETFAVEDYFIGYLKHPYVSLYTGRGCRSKCTFCLWPQTVGGHRYRTRSVGHVLEEMALIPKVLP